MEGLHIPIDHSTLHRVAKVKTDFGTRCSGSLDARKFGQFGSVFFFFSRMSRKLGWFLMVCCFVFDIEIGKTVYRNFFFL